MPEIQRLSPWDIVIAAACLLLLTLAGVRRAREQTEEDFLVGGRNIGGWQLAGTISAGIMGGGVLMVYAEYIFRFGLSALWIVAGLILGVLVLVPIALRLKPLADEQKFYTLPDLYAFQWGRLPGFLATLIVALWTFGFIIMQLISAGEVLSVMTAWPYVTCVFVSGATVLTYLLISGFKAVVITDTIQYGALCLICLILLIASLGHRVTVEDVVAVTTAGGGMDLGTGLGFFLLGGLNILVSADLWQRVYAARSLRAAKRGFALSALWIFVAAVLLILPLILVKRDYPTAQPNQALMGSLSILVPRQLLAFGFVALLAAVVSALDTMAFVFGIAVGHDILIRTLNRPPEGRVRYTRGSMAVILALGCLVSVFWRNLLDTGVALSTLGLVLAPSLLLLLTKKWKPKAKAVEWGLWGGFLTTLALLFSGNLTPETSIASFAVAMVLTFAGIVYYKPQSHAS